MRPLRQPRDSQVTSCLVQEGPLACAGGSRAGSGGAGGGATRQPRWHGSGRVTSEGPCKRAPDSDPAPPTTEEARWKHRLPGADGAGEARRGAGTQHGAWQAWWPQLLPQAAQQGARSAAVETDPAGGSADPGTHGRRPSPDTGTLLARPRSDAGVPSGPLKLLRPRSSPFLPAHGALERLRPSLPGGGWGGPTPHPGVSSAPTFPGACLSLSAGR